MAEACRVLLSGLSVLCSPRILFHDEILWCDLVGLRHLIMLPNIVVRASRLMILSISRNLVSSFSLPLSIISWSCLKIWWKDLVSWYHLMILSRESCLVTRSSARAPCPDLTRSVPMSPRGPETVERRSSGATGPSRSLFFTRLSRSS